MLLNIVNMSLREMVKIYFDLLKTQARFVKKIKSKGFLASSVSTYVFSTLYTT